MIKLILIFSFVFSISFSQTELQIQYRNRSEFANSLRIFDDDKLNNNFSSAQRARIGLFHSTENYDFGIQIQDVRTWGQDRSTIAPISDPNADAIMVHQAYLNIKLENLIGFKSNLKLGRQELLFDDQRLIGALDWLNQARRHDLALLKIQPNETNEIQLAYAFNQNGYKKNGFVYNGIAGIYPSGSNGLSQNYKSLLMLTYMNKNKFLPFHIFFLNDNFSILDTLNNPTTEANSRYTIGSKISKSFNDIDMNISYYKQLGTTVNNLDLDAIMFISKLTYTQNKLISSIGYDYLSGTDKTDGINTSNLVNTFDPLYGMPHKFYGYLDLFYAPIGQGLNGFSDAYLMFDYQQNSKLSFQLSGHLFNLTNKLIENGEELDPYIGTEIDFVTSYLLFDKIKFDLGISYMLANETLFSSSVMNITNSVTSPYFVYLMIDLKEVIKLN